MNGRVLVVFTTTDYIDFITRHHPGRAVFVTEPDARLQSREEPPCPADEVLVLMDDPGVIAQAVRDHLGRHGFQALGVACFDCESMYFASSIAREFHLPYPSEEAVLACRNKYVSKRRWREAGLERPDAALVRCVEDAEDFLRRHVGGVVLKPLCGAGSEHVFVCGSPEGCGQALDVLRGDIRSGLGERLYASYRQQDSGIDPKRVFLAEEFAQGEEYSCDFFIHEDKVEVIRITRKWLKADPAPGTVLAYQALPSPPEGIGRDVFIETLRCAAQSLGIERAVCMLDFMVHSGRMILLELAPRPGGDCLPDVLRSCCGLDIIGLELDAAEGLPLRIPVLNPGDALIGLRLFAPLAGIIRDVDVSALRIDPRVKEIVLRAESGRLVRLPPEDYDSRILGHVIFRPYSDDTAEEECLELHDKMIVSYMEEERIDS